MEEFLDLILKFYGLDWLCMAFGLTGTWLMTRKNRAGFGFNALACVCGVSVAVLSGQIGYIVYNGIIMAMMVRGYMAWGSQAGDVGLAGAETAEMPVSNS